MSIQTVPAGPTAPPIPHKPVLPFVAGRLYTADLRGGVGAEKDKVRPVVAIAANARTVLAVAVTDARKGRVPTHALIRGFSSGTQVKDALVACEHAWSLDPSRLAPRDDARPLTDDELHRIGQCLRIAVGLLPSRPPPAPPPHPRGARIRVDLAGAVGAEAQGVVDAVVLSNDAGNYFGRTFLVAPVVSGDDAILPVLTLAGAVDLGRLRIADQDRIVGPGGPALSPADLASVEAALQSLIPWA